MKASLNKLDARTPFCCRRVFAIANSTGLRTRADLPIVLFCALAYLCVRAQARVQVAFAPKRARVSPASKTLSWEIRRFQPRRETHTHESSARKDPVADRFKSPRVCLSLPLWLASARASLLSSCGLLRAELNAGALHAFAFLLGLRSPSFPRPYVESEKWPLCSCAAVQRAPHFAA